MEHPQNRLVEQAVSDGRIPIGYSCSFVPEPFLMVDKLLPVRLYAPRITSTETADYYLSNFICSYTRSLLEFALDDRFDLIKGWVFVPSCAHMQRFFDNLEYYNKPEFNHVLDVPRKVNSGTIAWQVEELEILADKLSSHFGVDMGDDALQKAITEWNEFTIIIRSIGELRKSPTPLITGTEFHELLMASLVSPKDLILPDIINFKKKIEQREPTRTYRARIGVVGTHLQDPEFIGLIESQGGLVVADLFCTGSIPGFEPVEVNGNPINSLANHSLKNTLCPRMMEDFDLRLKTIIDTVQNYKIDGVIIEIIKFCDLWGMDSVPMVDALRDAGIPVLKLEREYSLGGEGQLRTRVQAFIESMGK